MAEVPAVVKNVSRDGAMLEVVGAPPRGTEATIVSDASEVQVTMMWANERAAGVRFVTVQA